jgi:hypothetical protein
VRGGRQLEPAGPERNGLGYDLEVFDPSHPSGLFVFLAIVVPLTIVLGLRRMAPGRPRLAMFLAIMFGPCGHFYVKGAAKYVGLMYAAGWGLLVATPLPPIVNGLLLATLSALLMKVRMGNAAEASRSGRG